MQFSAEGRCSAPRFQPESRSDKDERQKPGLSSDILAFVMGLKIEDGYLLLRQLLHIACPDARKFRLMSPLRSPANSERTGSDVYDDDMINKSRQTISHLGDRSGFVINGHNDCCAVIFIHSRTGDHFLSN